MPKWNVLTGVVEIVEAPDKETAIRTLENTLKSYGFSVYDVSTTSVMPDAFESEDTEGAV